VRNFNAHAYRNHITVAIKNRVFSALLDTGASKSICNLNLVKSLHYAVKALEPGEIGMLISANGSAMRVNGKVDLPIKINGITIYHTFYVIQSVTHQIILGLYFLEATCAKIDLKSKTVSFFDELITANLTVISETERQFISTKSNITLQPISETIIPVSVNNSYPLETSIIEPLQDDLSKFCVARCVVNLQEHETVCKLLNPTESVIKIPRNTIIATIEPISADECFLFYADNDKDVISLVTDSDCELHTTQNTTPDRSEVRKILSELGVKIGDGQLTSSSFITIVFYIRFSMLAWVGWFPPIKSCDSLLGVV